MEVPHRFTTSFRAAFGFHKKQGKAAALIVGNKSRRDRRVTGGRQTRLKAALDSVAARRMAQTAGSTGAEKTSQSARRLPSSVTLTKPKI